MEYIFTSTRAIMKGIENSHLNDYVNTLKLNDFHITSALDENGHCKYKIILNTAEDISRITTLLNQSLIVNQDVIEIYDDYRE